MGYGFTSFVMNKQPPPFVNELRIGNWISSYAAFLVGNEFSHKEIRKVKVDGDLLKFLIDHPLATFKGIPLSSDILEKCGEKYISNDRNWEYQISVGALKWFFRWNIEWYSEIGGIYIGANVQYLHQVQNLYFYFTGRELTVNL